MRNTLAIDKNQSREEALIDIYRKNETDLKMVDFKISNPELFNLPAGPVGLLLGVEYREESYSDDRDPRLEREDDRLVGQDSGRGTFFHRHAVLHDQNSGDSLTPLGEINPEVNVAIIDSLLSEEAVLALFSGLLIAVVEETFFRGALDKVGVQAQFEGVGKYKNAPNQFTETGFTGPHREQMESLLDSLFSQYVAAVAESRIPLGTVAVSGLGPALLAIIFGLVTALILVSFASTIGASTFSRAVKLASRL